MTSWDEATAPLVDATSPLVDATEDDDETTDASVDTTAAVWAWTTDFEKPLKLFI